MNWRRLTPRGLIGFVRCAIAQRRFVQPTWRDSLRVAWKYGPIR